MRICLAVLCIIGLILSIWLQLKEQRKVRRIRIFESFFGRQTKLSQEEAMIYTFVSLVGFEDRSLIFIKDKDLRDATNVVRQELKTRCIY
jgi:hypothetical protein